MATYERRSGAHVAERVQPVPGSEEETAYAVLAEDPASGWRVIEEPAPQKTGSRRAKAREG